MAVSIGANTGSFTIPAGLSVGTHTIQIRETNAPSIVSSTVTFTVGSAAAIAPALGTTNLLADFDPNVAGSRTLSGSTITALSTANGPAGSVAITGRQTAVYPSTTPGGWRLVGRTPLEMVNVEDEYFPIGAGDRVNFFAIDEETFNQRLGQRA